KWIVIIAVRYNRVLVSIIFIAYSHRASLPIFAQSCTLFSLVKVVFASRIFIFLMESANLLCRFVLVNIFIIFKIVKTFCSGKEFQDICEIGFSGEGDKGFHFVGIATGILKHLP